MDFLKHYKILETLNSLSWDNFIIRARSLLFLKIINFVDYVESTLTKKTSSSWGHWFKVKLGILNPEVEDKPVSLVKRWSMLEDFKFRLAAWTLLDYLFSSFVSGLISLRRLYLFFNSYLRSKDSKKYTLNFLMELYSNSFRRYAPKNFGQEQSIQKALWNALFLGEGYNEIFDSSKSSNWRDLTQVRSFEKHDFYGILKKTSFFISTILVLSYFSLYLRSFYFYLSSDLNSRKKVKAHTRDLLIIFASLMLIFPFKSKLKENLIEKVKLSLKDLTFYFFTMPFKNWVNYEELAFSTLSFLEFLSIAYRTSLFIIILLYSPLREGLIQFLSWVKFLIKSTFSLKRISKRLLNNLESYEKFSYNSYTSSPYGFSFILEKYYPGLRGSYFFDDSNYYSLYNGFYQWLIWANNYALKNFRPYWILPESYWVSPESNSEEHPLLKALGDNDLNYFRIVFNFWEIIVASNSFTSPVFLKNFFQDTFSNIFGIKNQGFGYKLLRPLRNLFNWTTFSYGNSKTDSWVERSLLMTIYCFIKRSLIHYIGRAFMIQFLMFSNLFSTTCQLILGTPWVLGLLAIKMSFN